VHTRETLALMLQWHLALRDTLLSRSAKESDGSKAVENPMGDQSAMPVCTVL
jgi:hypothetical protein